LIKVVFPSRETMSEGVKTDILFFWSS